MVHITKEQEHIIEICEILKDITCMISSKNAFINTKLIESFNKADKIARSYEPNA